MNWTIAKLIQWTTDYFQQHNIATPRLDAEVLLAHVLNIDRVHLYVHFEKPIEPHERDRFREMVRRRASREPVAYIIGYKEFYSLNFHVNSSVLIPRPETELLVEECLFFLDKHFKTDLNPRVLELGTGCGAITLSVAFHYRHGDYFATDISAEVLRCAMENAHELGLSERVTFFECDLFPPSNEITAPFDIIISNPPYIKTAILDTLEPEVSLFEPRLALDGGPDGLEFYRSIIENSFKKLTKNGIIMLEVDDDVAADVVILFKQNHPDTVVECKKDLSGHNRLVIALNRDS